MANWIRLEVDVFDDPAMADFSDSERVAWVRLLCWVKRHGRSDGTCDLTDDLVRSCFRRRSTAAADKLLRRIGDAQYQGERIAEVVWPGEPSRSGAAAEPQPRGSRSVRIPKWGKYQGRGASKSRNVSSRSSREEKQAAFDLAEDGPPIDVRRRGKSLGLILPKSFPTWPLSWYEQAMADLALAFVEAKASPSVDYEDGSSDSVPGVWAVIGWLTRVWLSVESTADGRAEKHGGAPRYQSTARAWWTRMCDGVQRGDPRSLRELRDAVSSGHRLATDQEAAEAAAAMRTIFERARSRKAVS